MATENKSSAYLTNIDEVKKVFSRFDVNGDGKITAVELVDVMKALGSDTSLDEVNRIMADIDTDCDGFINLEEFAGFCKGNAAGEDDGGMTELHDAFKLYDLNKNGLISANELHQILSRLGESCTLDDCSNMIKSVDSDADGYVNFEEFRKMMSNNPSKLQVADLQLTSLTGEHSICRGGVETKMTRRNQRTWVGFPPFFPI